MRHQKRGRKFNRTASHRKAMMSNLASALILHKRIQTTDAKGKELRGFIERLVTYAKKGDVHARRLIQKKIKGILTKSIDEMELSVRSHNCLQAAGIRTIGELVSKEESEMLKFKNFGRKSLTELQEKLGELDLNFGMDVKQYLEVE